MVVVNWNCDVLNYRDIRYILDIRSKWRIALNIGLFEKGTLIDVVECS